MKRKTPQWAYVVGILMMLFGGCDGMESISQANTRESYQTQKELLDGLGQPDSDLSKLMESFLPDSVKADSAATKGLQQFGEMAKSMGAMVEMSEYSITWNVRFGYIGIFMALIYFIGGMFLLVKRPFSIRLVLGVLVANILFLMVQTIVLSLDDASGSMIQHANSASWIGVVIDLILIVFVATADHSAYRPESEFTPSDNDHLGLTNE